MRGRYLSDEQRAGREREVRAEHDETRRGEAECPIRRARVDHREQKVSAARQERARSDDERDVDAPNRERDYDIRDDATGEHG